MPSIINASSTGSGGIVQTADASGVLQLQSNGTTALTVSGANVTFAGTQTLTNNITTTGSINALNTFGFKNRVINGSMQIWQRGTSGSGANTFVADRWYINANNTTSAQSSDVPTGFRFSNLMTGTSASNAQLTHKIESYNADDLSGQAITVSFWAKSTSGSTQLGVYLSYATAQDNFSSTTAIGSTTFFTLTSSWAQYTVTFTTSAPSGVANGLQLGLYRSGTESSATYITGVQLEKGTQATSFDFRSIGTELNLCQRYCQGVSGVGRVSTSSAVEFWCKNPVVMRATPNATIKSGAQGYQFGRAASALSSMTTFYLGADGAGVTFTSADTGMTPGLPAGCTGDVALLSAEL
jgi:hypothetical protein